MTTYAYESIDEANAEVNRLIDELKDARRANRALLAQLDEEREQHAKSQEAYDNATAKLGEALDNANGNVDRLVEQSERQRIAAADMAVYIESLRAQLADMARRKDGWRRLTRGLYRYALIESVGGDGEGTEDYWNALDWMNDEIRRHLDDIENGVRMWGRGTYDGTVQQ